MKMKVLAITLVLLIICSQSCLGKRVRGGGRRGRPNNKQRKSPILIVPGLIASQLEAKVSGHGLLCNTIGYDNYWLNILKLPTCVSSVLSLQWDSETNRYSNADGVEVRVPGFGETESVEHLDEAGLVPMFHGFVEYFVKRGYKRGKDIRAAPYDWRLAADEHEREGYYENLKSLVEEMAADSGEKVTVVAHSMGGPLTLYFFNNVVSQSWKDSHINAYIPLSGAWSGGNMVIPILISGIESLLPEIPIISDYLKNLSPAFQSFQSMIWLLPNPSVANDMVLVSTDNKQYTANDYEELFTDANVPEYHEKHEHILEVNGDFPAPNVPTYCFYGVDVPTPEHFKYDSSLEHLIEIDMGDGDSQVNRVSSEVCLQWESQEQFFVSQEFSGANHIGMLSDNEILGEIAKVVFLE